ncbi:MAG: cytochrome [Herbaspirillum sp.]|nr:cytochrome [Herbaspirillum sp.]
MWNCNQQTEERQSMSSALFLQAGKMIANALRACARPIHAARLSSVAALFILANVGYAQTPVDGNVNRGIPAPSAATTCIACHAAAGAGSAAGIPRLAGQNPDYLAGALSMFKAGTRKSDIMQGVAHNLSDSEIRALSVYFSDQHPPAVQGAASPAPDLVAAGQRLAEAGAVPDIEACFSCHAAGGKGNGARFPSIAGQPAAFLVNRLHEFQARAKAAPPKAGTMTAVSATLNEAQIQAAAAYLSTLPQ